MATTRKNTKTATFVYDVTGGDSGAAGVHVIGALPGNAVLTQSLFNVVTTFTSAADTATIGVGVTGTATLFDTAIAINDGTNPWDAGRRVADEPTNQTVIPAAISDYHPLGATTALAVIVTTAVQTITAGKFELIVEYFIP